MIMLPVLAVLFAAAASARSCQSPSLSKCPLPPSPSSISASPADQDDTFATEYCDGGTNPDGESPNFMGLCSFTCSFGYCLPVLPGRFGKMDRIFKLVHWMESRMESRMGSS
ncbi:carbohydrate-binding module family 24 protein [Parathielavia hyrcaniae]|uniref:Carbohydrate-binding module family 24 protein n=1 Tax=Parathielavia hyrcaniae TaxID=113614 RepID=A0AAN6PVB7_9PEZI|nr:carbohydrate-binding module family 24 protein [Parathielavia hyrcaniae]